MEKVTTVQKQYKKLKIKKKHNKLLIQSSMPAGLRNYSKIVIVTYRTVVMAQTVLSQVGGLLAGC